MSTRALAHKSAHRESRKKTPEMRTQAAAKGAWRKAIGFAEGDELFRQAMDLGAAWREKAGSEDR